ncbi:MAG: hypothetical protein B2I17_09015 [Thermoplasmatales archaeon B_DKE]|nr:MAG: hypothetical protein B2I17_09015 [Thermoplasmatales archaeon B_DKE]
MSISLIGRALDKLRESTDDEFVIRRAFADWSELAESKKELQKLGIRAVDVLSDVHKNGATLKQWF